jgi:hypothetical protein
MESLSSLARMPDNPTRSGGFNVLVHSSIDSLCRCQSQGVIVRLQSSCEEPNRKGISLSDATRVVGM